MSNAGQPARAIFLCSYAHYQEMDHWRIGYRSRCKKHSINYCTQSRAITNKTQLQFVGKRTVALWQYSGLSGVPSGSTRKMSGVGIAGIGVVYRTKGSQPKSTRGRRTHLSKSLFTKASLFEQLQQPRVQGRQEWPRGVRESCTRVTMQLSYASLNLCHLQMSTSE